MAVEVVLGDITSMRVDAIVNAANEQLVAGGGVCGAIFAAAGHRQLQDACDAIGGCATGSAVATPAFDLGANGITAIVHAVGPRWDDTDPAAMDRLLSSAYRSALNVAAQVGARSIAFPALSTGIFGFPPQRASVIAAAEVRTREADFERIVLVAFDEPTEEILREALRGR